MNNLIIKERICQGISQWTGQPCGAKAVGENTLKKGTREFLDPRFCQMHQPGRLSKKKCICPYCTHCRNLEKIKTTRTESVVLNEEEEDENIAENLFGKNRKKQEKKGKKRFKK